VCSINSENPKLFDIFVCFLDLNRVELTGVLGPMLAKLGFPALKIKCTIMEYVEMGLICFAVSTN
jgi:hypothetical protein